MCYGPAWLCIISSFSIYILAGREIFKKRHELRAFNNSSEDYNRAFKTTDYQVTSEVESHPRKDDSFAANLTSPNRTSGNASETPHASYLKYNVNISASPRPRPSLHHASSEFRQQRKNRATMEANRAAFGYTKVASLFFVSMLVTWVPSSINRVFSLIYPNSISVPYAYAAGVVLSLMGFWNSIIYITTSRAACRALFSSIIRKFGADVPADDDDGVREMTTRKRGRVGGGGSSYGDSSEELRSAEAV